MYNNWLRIIEGKMGRRFRKSLETTIWMCGLVLSSAALIVSVLFCLWYFIAIFIEGPVYILYFILSLSIAVVSTFFVNYCME